jgi:N-acetyl-gamma-glutamyl-phosphate reductase
LEELQQTYQQAYAEEPFVRLLKTPPDLQRVTGSNICDLYVTMEEQHVVVISALDNLVKGAAGQALQNLNLLIGCDETRGLHSPNAYP